ncbi:MAG: NHLP family bacteriocin export ABC transporter peptidase/permease/ATPase subunit [Reyranella sp.]|nr:NHLP family bacteriocin export ABC transporter peptidase/permease/ATPase subunit [Reyranella sp.]
MIFNALRKHRVRTPTVFQMEMAESGAAALGIVLAYHGRRVPLEQLRAACGVSRDGSKPADLVRAAAGYGVDTVSAPRQADEVLAGPFPVVVSWSADHFLVVEGISGGKIHLNDPATGPRSISRDDFNRGFKGHALAFSPGKTFKRGHTAPSLMGKLHRRLKGLNGVIAFVSWISLLLVIPGMILPGMTAVFVDKVLIRQYDSWLGPILIGLGVALLLNIALRWLQALALLRVEMRLALEQSAVFTRHVLQLPIDFFGQRFGGDIVSRVEANDRVATLLARDFGNAAASCLTATFLGAVMISYDTVLAAIVLGSAALNILVVRVLRRSLSDIALRLQTEQGKLFATSVIGLQSIETLKAGAGESDFFSKWAGLHARAISAEQRLAIYQITMSLVPIMVLSLTSAAVLGVGALRIMDGYLTIGTLVAFQGLLLNFSAPIQQLVDVASRVQQASADLSRLDDVLDNKRDWRFSVPPNAPADARAAGRLSIRDLTFGYNAFDAPLIEGFSLDVEPGQWVALVGGSGSGKSTLGKLITGLFEPQAGQILIDGYTLQDWGRERLSNIVASVDQDIRLFSGTVHGNVTLWDDTIDNNRLVAAIDDAGLTPIVAAMPGNFQGVIEEGGRNLNGGQRQRIEIARALIREPAILILDEATAALDAESEYEILTAVRHRGMTCVLVAHRLSTIRDCDEIIVLERGKVVERGTHVSLMAASGAYARLIKAEVAA